MNKEEKELVKEIHARTSLLAAIVTRDCEQILSTCKKCGYFDPMPLVHTKYPMKLMCPACLHLQTYKRSANQPYTNNKED